MFSTIEDDTNRGTGSNSCCRVSLSHYERCEAEAYELEFAESELSDFDLRQSAEDSKQLVWAVSLAQLSRLVGRSRS